jgi:hypothetical protein
MKTKWLWGSMFLWLVACLLIGCGTVIPHKSPPHPPDPAVIYPRDVAVVTFLAPDDDPFSSTVKMRFLVEALPSKGSLLQLEFDPDGGGPLGMEEVQVVAMGVRNEYSGDRNCWYFDYELPVKSGLGAFVVHLQFEEEVVAFPVFGSIGHVYEVWPY